MNRLMMPGDALVDFGAFDAMPSWIYEYYYYRDVYMIWRKKKKNKHINCYCVTHDQNEMEYLLDPPTHLTH